MMSARTLVSRSAPLLACLGLLGIWQMAALILDTDSFPTALAGDLRDSIHPRRQGIPDQHSGLAAPHGDRL